MFRTLRSLILVSIATAVPASVYATEPTKNHSSHASSASKSSISPASTKLTTTAKLDVHKTTIGKTTFNASTKFPKLNTGYTPKVDKKTAGKFAKKDFDHDYHKLHGTKFSHGYYYCGKNHNHWSYCCWDPCCGCYLYWCPCTCCYYYYCQPDCCFFPVCYCPYQTYNWVNCYVVECIPVVACECVEPQ
jgi:hypothetical protein